MNAPSPPPVAVAFDGSRAFEHVRKQVEFGPRPAGSAELANARNYIVGELQSYGLKVTQDQFTATTPQGPKQMVNVTAELPGASQEVVMITSHYDTKFFRDFKFVGANDGGSSTGALMELARVLAAGAKPRYTYWFTFFDGEEAFCEEWDQCRNADGPDHLYGSRRFVKQLQERDETKRVRAMILLDMMGYKDLQLGWDDLGYARARWLVDIVWQTARELGHSQVFQNRIEGVGGDDHKPFLDAGIPSIDLIQLNSYGPDENTTYWHTKDDTLDKISPRSLKIVGDVVLASLPKIEDRLQKGTAK